MERTNFEKLQVYELSERSSDEIWSIVFGWDHFAKDTIGKQIVRAVDGVGANIAEGSGRGTLADNRRFIRMARGSLYETKHWLRRAYRRTLLTEQQIDKVKPVIRELLPKLNAYCRSVDLADARSRSGRKQSTKNKAQSSEPK
jgi:four helix bundle protein